MSELNYSIKMCRLIKMIKKIKLYVAYKKSTIGKDTQKTECEGMKKW
jgi:hypothetical protein